MFDAIFNNLIILIPLAIFIGRIVVAAGKKQNPPPRIPVHFEDDGEEAKPAAKIPSRPAISLSMAGEHSRALGRDAAAKTVPRPAAARVKNRAKEKRPLSPRVSGDLAADMAEAEKAAVRGAANSGPAAPASGGSSAVSEQSGFPQNLGRLSPLKRAVVMTEILGPPKALQ